MFNSQWRWPKYDELFKCNQWMLHPKEDKYDFGLSTVDIVNVTRFNC